MSVFIGTTNQDKPLHDPTGNRRFWPVEAGCIDLDAVRRDRNQLFAEAVSRFKSGHSWWDVPLEAALAAQEADFEEDPWAETVTEWLANPTHTTVTVSQVAEGALNISEAKVSLIESRRLGSILRRAKWVQKYASRDGKTYRLWHRPASSEPYTSDTPSA